MQRYCLPAEAPETPFTVLGVVATADTVLCPAMPASAPDTDASLRVGPGGGYADDGHLLVRFDDLPAVPARDVLQVRLGLWREWRGNAHDDGDEALGPGNLLEHRQGERHALRQQALEVVEDDQRRLRAEDGN